MAIQKMELTKATKGYFKISVLRQILVQKYEHVNILWLQTALLLIDNQLSESNILWQMLVTWGQLGTWYPGSRQFSTLVKPCPSTTLIERRSCVTNSAIRFVMAVARSGGHTREKLWSVLYVLQLLLESFIHHLYFSRCIACKWLIKLDVPPSSASCWVQRRYCTLGTEKILHSFYVFATDFRHSWWLEELPNGTCTLYIRHGSLLAFSSTACTIAVFHTCLAPSGLVPRYGNGSGNEIKKPL